LIIVIPSIPVSPQLVLSFVKNLFDD